MSQILPAEAHPTKTLPLLFIDTNIWLDFYRYSTEAGISLLEHVESVADKVIVSPQVEMEFKKNRQGTILQAIKDLKEFKSASLPAMFSDAQAARALRKHCDEAHALIRKMNTRLRKILEDPGTHDRVYKTFQRIHRKADPLALSREDPVRRVIRNKARNRFLLGYPPRKKSDTSMGDAMNWEWIIHCAKDQKSNVVIVSRDSDYGINSGDKIYLNDHLKQEFNERVSSKRRLMLCARLSDGLKQLKISVTKPEKEEESRIVASATVGNLPPKDELNEIMSLIRTRRNFTIPLGIEDISGDDDRGDAST